MQNKEQNVQVSDTTGDHPRIEAGYKKIYKHLYNFKQTS